MPAHIDEPEPDVPVDPLCFLVRGWFRLADPEYEVPAIEAWCDNVKVGETRQLFPRADVAANLGVAAIERVGFELFAHHPSATPGAQLKLAVRARRTDGFLTEPL